MTEGAKSAVALCEKWAAKVVAELPCELFLFGSAIYKQGEQFNNESSDLDIVVIFPEPTSAIARVSFLQRLGEHKAGLELDMIPALARTSCTVAGSSIVAITQFELKANIHKSGVRQFFTKSFFYDLIYKKQIDGLANAGTKALRDEDRYSIEYVQRVRNNFLARSANGSGGVSAYDGPDPLPKELMRMAAQRLDGLPYGESFDTRHGLDAISESLSARKAEGSEIKDLHKCVSVRRGARGKHPHLSPANQLLVNELLFDQASGENKDQSSK